MRKTSCTSVKYVAFNDLNCPLFAVKLCQKLTKCQNAAKWENAFKKLQDLLYVSMVTRSRVPDAKAESLQIVSIVFLHIQSKGCQGKFSSGVLWWSVRVMNSLTNQHFSNFFYSDHTEKKMDDRFSFQTATNNLICSFNCAVYVRYISDSQLTACHFRPFSDSQRQYIYTVCLLHLSFCKSTPQAKQVKYPC